MIIKAIRNFGAVLTNCKKFDVVFENTDVCSQSCIMKCDVKWAKMVKNGQIWAKTGKNEQNSGKKWAKMDFAHFCPFYRIFFGTKHQIHRTFCRLWKMCSIESKFWEKFLILASQSCHLHLMTEFSMLQNGQKSTKWVKMDKNGQKRIKMGKTENNRFYYTRLTANVCNFWRFKTDWKMIAWTLKMRNVQEVERDGWTCGLNI